MRPGLPYTPRGEEPEAGERALGLLRVGRGLPAQLPPGPGAAAAAALPTLTLTPLALAPGAARPHALAAPLAGQRDRLVLAEDAGAGVGQEVVQPGGLQPPVEGGRVGDGVGAHACSR